MLDIVGKRFGKLVVTEATEERTPQGIRFFAADCDCGTRRKLIRKGDLTSGRTISCGCHIAEVVKRPRKHGLSRHPLANTWQHIMQRCYNPRSASFGNYGARGIHVCERWHSMQQFILDNDGKNLPGLSIDRIDNDGPYSPENCRWATQREQNLNKRNNVLMTLNGETRPLAQWANELGISAWAIRRRVRDGWPDDLALTLPIDPSNKRATLIEWRGVVAPLGVHIKASAISLETARWRLKSGWSVEDALTKPVSQKRPPKTSNAET